MTKYMSQKIKGLCNKSGRRCTVLNHAIYVEKDLEKICKKVWEFTNPKHEKFLFARYVNPNDTTDTTIVTIGYHLPRCWPNYVHIN